MRDLSELPDGWRIVPLEQIAEERRVRANSAPHADVFSVTKHNGFVRSLEYFERQVFSRDTSNYKVVRRGDLAYATIHLDEGSLGILRDADAGLISPMYTVFAVDRSQVKPDYLFSLMKLPQMVSRYGRIGEGTVHRRKSISFERLGRLSFVIPPVEEQRRIMAVLDAIDEAIERTEAVISATECLRDALLHELLTRGVRGWHSKWRNVPGLGTLPEGWRIAKLGDLAEIVMGQSPPGRTVSDWDGDARYEDGLPFIQGNAEFASEHPEPEKWCNKPLKVAEHGDTLISVRAPVGETNRANCRMAIGRGLAAIRFTKADSDYGWHIVNRAKLEFLRVAQGSTFHAIGRDDVHGLTVALPPLPE